MKSTDTRNKHIPKLYDHISLIVDRGKKEVIRAHADKNGESINAFINRIIAEALENEKQV